MSILDNLPLSQNMQTAFTNLQIDHMMLPTGPEKDGDGATIPPDKRLVRWTLNKPLFLAKGDNYTLPSLRVVERSLVPKLDIDGAPLLDKHSNPVMVPTGPPCVIEFGFTVKRSGNKKTHTIWRYGKPEATSA